METYTIQDALNQEKGTIVTRLKAKLINVYPRENKEGQYGPYTKQNGMIEDGTGKMKISVMDFNDLSSRVGSTIIFKSMQGKGGIKGVAVDRYEWKGKQEIVLKVSGKTALMVSDGEEDKVQPVKDIPRVDEGISYGLTPSLLHVNVKSEKDVQMPKKDVPDKSFKDIHEDRKLMLATAKNRLTQLAGLYDLCWKTVDCMEFLKDEELDEAHHKDIATTLFIQSVREGLADKMIIRTLDKFYKEDKISSSTHTGEPSSFDEGMKDDDIPF